MSRVRLCQCGCGEQIVSRKRSRAQYRKGHYQAHNARHLLTSADYSVEDRGYETPCWISNAKAWSTGYVSLRWRGKRIAAHRAMYEQEVGPIPEGMMLDHLCRITMCMNPAHVEPVTARENARRGNQTKLTPDKVRQIRKSDLGATALGRQLGVSVATIQSVRNRERWADIPD